MMLIVGLIEWVLIIVGCYKLSVIKFSDAFLLAWSESENKMNERLNALWALRNKE
jgi:hypothetical protein